MIVTTPKDAKCILCIWAIPWRSAGQRWYCARQSLGYLTPGSNPKYWESNREAMGIIFTVYCMNQSLVLEAAVSAGTPRLPWPLWPPSERQSIPSVLGLPMGLLLVGQAWNIRKHPKDMPEPPQLTPLNAEEQRLYFELLLGNWTPRPVPKGTTSHQTEETPFVCLYPQSHSFGRYQNSWGWKRKSTSKSKAFSLSAQLLPNHNRPVQRTPSPHRSTCHSCAQSFFYSWARSWDTWTPPPEAGSLNWSRDDKPPNSFKILTVSVSHPDQRV